MALPPEGGEVDFTDGEARDMWAIFNGRRCDHCGGAHSRACPRVRRIEFHQNGTVLSVEFWPSGKWPEDGVIWPENLPPDPDERD